MDKNIRAITLIALIATLSACASIAPTAVASGANALPAAQSTPQPADALSVTLEPEMAGADLQAVRVSYRLLGDADGETVLHLPDDYAYANDYWRFIDSVTADGATLSAEDNGMYRLRHAPGAAIHFSYRVKSAYAQDPAAGTGGNPYDGAAIRPAWFAAQGEMLFASVDGRDTSPVELIWRGWPANWQTGSTLTGQSITGNRLIESSLLAGSDVIQLGRRLADGSTMTVFVRGQWQNFTNETVADHLARIINSQRSFFGRSQGDYTITLWSLAQPNSGSSIGGNGRADGFSLFATPDTKMADVTSAIAHEYVHNWIPQRLGAAEDGVDKWLAEGFTDYYTTRTLLSGRIWNRADFARWINDELRDYYQSPARNMPNAEVEAKYWTDPAVQKIPYRRGMLMAFLLDQALRDRGQSLDAVILAMQDRWVADVSAKRKPAVIIDALRDEMARRGVDFAPFQRMIDSGETLFLQPDTLGQCGRFERQSVPDFYPGFNRNESARLGQITGVDQSGPAYAAGLRDGMRRVSRLSGEEGNAAVPLGYRIADASGERDISWLPAGQGRIDLQLFVPTPGQEQEFCF